MVVVESLVWDEWNTAHIEKHLVLREEVEEAYSNLIETYKSYKDRPIFIGKTNSGRLITVVLTYLNSGQYYVVSARDASRKERRRIEQKK